MRLFGFPLNRAAVAFRAIESQVSESRCRARRCGEVPKVGRGEPILPEPATSNKSVADSRLRISASRQKKQQRSKLLQRIRASTFDCKHFSAGKHSRCFGNNSGDYLLRLRVNQPSPLAASVLRALAASHRYASASKNKQAAGESCDVGVLLGTPPKWVCLAFISVSLLKPQKGGSSKRHTHIDIECQATCQTCRQRCAGSMERKAWQRRWLCMPRCDNPRAFLPKKKTHPVPQSISTWRRNFCPARSFRQIAIRRPRSQRKKSGHGSGHHEQVFSVARQAG